MRQHTGALLLAQTQPSMFCVLPQILGRTGFRSWGWCCEQVGAEIVQQIAKHGGKLIISINLSELNLA